MVFEGLEFVFVDMKFPDTVLTFVRAGICT